METFNKFASNQGKRITISDLLEFISKNSKEIKNIDVVDSSSSDTQNESDDDAILNDVLETGEVGKIKILPTNLDQLFKKFSDRFLHMGALHNLDDKSKLDISYFTSVFYCLRYSFSSLSVDEQRVFMNRFFEGFRKGISMGYFEEFGYNKLKWNKVEIVKQVCDLAMTKCVMRYFADYLCVNIFILDVTDDTFYYTGGDFIPYKKNIFLLKQEHYEPLITEKGRIFNVGDDVMKHIIENKEFVQLFNLNYKETKDVKTFSFTVVEEDLSRYIDMKQFECVKVPEDINGYDESNCSDEEVTSDSSEAEEIRDIKPVKKVTTKSSKSKSSDDNESDTQSESDIKTETSMNVEKLANPMKVPLNITSKSKLLDVQAAAKKVGISIVSSGKNKTKDVLYKEIMQLMNKNDVKRVKGKK
jgi:hypothetical protein